jgi:hypothetical protein
MKTLGKTVWAIAGGHIPLNSTGREPEFTSRDELCLLNTSDQEANVKITIFYADKEPVGPYRLKVQARRIRHIRFNDLIDPEAIFLDTDYASVIESDIPIVAQFKRLDSSQAENSISTTMAFAAI